MKIVITGITQLKQSEIILIHGIRYNTKDGPEGISFQASYNDYPYLYSCMETTTPIYVEKFKLINNSEQQ